MAFLRHIMPQNKTIFFVFDTKFFQKYKVDLLPKLILEEICIVEQS